MQEVNKRWASYKVKFISPKNLDDKQKDEKPLENSRLCLDVQGQYNETTLGKESFPGKNKLGVLVDKVEEVSNPIIQIELLKEVLTLRESKPQRNMLKEYNLYFKNVGMPDLEHMEKHKKKNKEKLEVGDLIKKNFKGFLRKGIKIKIINISVYGVFLKYL